MLYKIGQGITLREYVLLCIENEENGRWMISEGIDHTMDMLVYPVELDDWNIEPEEYERIEEDVLAQGKGYRNLLNVDQLVDVVAALREQRAHYTEKELEASLDYYSKKDSFLEL